MSIMIDCERLLLRGVREDDVERLYQICSEPNIVKWLPAWNISVNEWIKWVKWQGEQYQVASSKETHVYQVITQKTNNHIIGLVGLNTRADLGNQTEVTCFVTNRHANKGYATEAVCAMLRCGAKRLELEQIIALCHASNYSAKRVIEKCGFSFTESKQFMNVGNRRPHEYEFYQYIADKEV